MAENATILQFKGMPQYTSYWDKVIADAITTETPYGKWLKAWPADINKQLKLPDAMKHYGNPVPENYKSAMARNIFLNMPLYNNAYQEIKPFLQQLEKASFAIMPKEEIRPNDLNLGIFSFDRAMMSIAGAPAFYSKKHKKYFLANQVDFKEVKKGTAISYKYFLKSDGSELELKQLVEDGELQWYSNNKKCFLYKEKVIKPNNGIHLYILVGANWGGDTFWAGIAGMIIAQYLEMRGYNVRITGVFGGYLHKAKFNHKEEGGYRIDTVELKHYSDTYDSMGLLYVMSDPSFFRIRHFAYLMASQYKYKDGFEPSLGSMLQVEPFKNILSEQQKLKNIATEENTIPFYLGGEEVKDMESTKHFIMEVIMKAEQENKDILDKIRARQGSPVW